MFEVSDVQSKNDMEQRSPGRLMRMKNSSKLSMPCNLDPSYGLGRDMEILNPLMTGTNIPHMYDRILEEILIIPTLNLRYMGFAKWNRCD